jgi:hypothetical protein
LNPGQKIVHLDSIRESGVNEAIANKLHNIALAQHQKLHQGEKVANSLLYDANANILHSLTHQNMLTGAGVQLGFESQNDNLYQS